MIAVNTNSEIRYGCPYCGYKEPRGKGSSWINLVKPSGVYSCQSCKKEYKIAREGDQVTTHPFRPSKRRKTKK